MASVLRKITDRAIAATGALFGIAKKIDYKTLNRYVIGMNECLTPDHVLLEASRCLKDILNYQMFAFAVQDAGQLDIWIDPRMYQKPMETIILRDFGSVPVRQVHYLTDSEGEPVNQMTFQEDRLLSHVMVNPHWLARLYVLPNRRMMPYHGEILDTIVKTIGIALNNCLNIRRLENDIAVDPLTGCYNRREFDRLIDHQIAGAQRHGTPLSMIMFDIDFFKQVNDTYGHPAGDAVLVQVTELVRKAVRKGDYLVRFGGEEFIVVLPETKLRRAMELAGRLRSMLEMLDIRIPDGRIIRKTASFGVVSLKPDWDAGRLVAEADAMLYQAKALGRNRVAPALELCVREGNR